MLGRWAVGHPNVPTSQRPNQVVYGFLAASFFASGFFASLFVAGGIVAGAAAGGGGGGGKYASLYTGLAVFLIESIRRTMSLNEGNRYPFFAAAGSAAAGSGWSL